MPRGKKPISDNFADLWHASRTVRDAANAAGMSVSHAHGIALAMGLPRKARRRGYRVDTVNRDKAKALRAEGLTYEAIAKQIGRSKTFAYNHGSAP